MSRTKRKPELKTQTMTFKMDEYFLEVWTSDLSCFATGTSSVVCVYKTQIEIHLSLTQNLHSYIVLCLNINLLTENIAFIFNASSPSVQFTVWKKTILFSYFLSEGPSSLLKLGGRSLDQSLLIDGQLDTESSDSALFLLDWTLQSANTNMFSLISRGSLKILWWQRHSGS